jgi:hypothetical protein
MYRVIRGEAIEVWEDGPPYRDSADVLPWPGTPRGSNDQQTIPLPVSSIRSSGGASVAFAPFNLYQSNRSISGIISGLKTRPFLTQSNLTFFTAINTLPSIAIPT